MQMIPGRATHGSDRGATSVSRWQFKGCWLLRFINWEMAIFHYFQTEENKSTPYRHAALVLSRPEVVPAPEADHLDHVRLPDAVVVRVQATATGSDVIAVV